MRLNFFKPFPLLVILTGCQILRPYTGPIAPTPDHWKNISNSPFEEQGSLPDAWKGENETPSSPPLSSDPQEQNEEIALDSSTEIKTEEEQYQEMRGELGNWWEVFQDPVLNQLEERAIESSYTLWGALERVIEARDLAKMSFSPLLPGLNFAPSFTKSGTLFQNPLTAPLVIPTAPAAPPISSSSSAAAATSTSISLPKDFRFVQSEYLFPLNFTYEVDLWCKLHNTYYASIYRWQASSQAYLSVFLSLTADIASSYFQLRSLDAQHEVLQKTIDARKKAFEINRARYQAGIIFFLDVSQAEVELFRALSDDDDVERLRGLEENILAALVGTPPSVFSLSYSPLLGLPPVIPSGLPSELLSRRPDIAESERDLAAAYSEIGVAYANFFPSLNLNAGIGIESPFADQLGMWKARYWDFGINVMQTVFDAGRNEANFDLYKARFREAMANYQETVLRSFKDVEDSLVNLRGYAKQSQDLDKAVAAARTTLELSQMRYNRGLVNYLEVVDSERTLLEVEQKSVIILGNRFSSTVKLIRSLGGGWGSLQ